MECDRPGPGGANRLPVPAIRAGQSTRSPAGAPRRWP